MHLSDFVDNDDDHQKAAAETGFWGKQGAGCLVYARNTKMFLVAFRSEYVMEGETWGTWGGAIDSGENPSSAVIRELKEEAGFDGQVEDIIPVYVFEKDTFRYSNFIVVIEDEFEPDLNWENSDYSWVSIDDFPTPQHFGLQELLSDSDTIEVMRSLVEA